MSRMRAVQFSEHGGSAVLRVVDLPVPVPGPGEVLVENHVAGINFIDTYHRSGLYPVPLPYVPGREGAGVVRAVGAGVPHLRPGDRVAYLATHSYAEYAVCEAGLAVQLPDAISFDVGAGMLLQGITTLGLMRKAYPVQAGDVVLVHAAAGGCGLWLCKLCKLASARVIGTTSTPEKGALAKATGADEIIYYTSEDVAARVLELTGGKGVNAVFDGIGKATFDASLASVAHLGFLISFGNASGKVPPLDIGRLTKNSVRLMRTTMYDFLRGPGDFAGFAREILQLLEQGTLSIHVHKVFPLDAVAEAHDELEGRKTTGKLLLRCK